ncbi:MAG: hypothetical protein C4295_04010 [Candidatus Fervidibacterota bacterium]
MPFKGEEGCQKPKCLLPFPFHRHPSPEHLTKLFCGRVKEGLVQKGKEGESSLLRQQQNRTEGKLCGRGKGQSDEGKDRMSAFGQRLKRGREKEGEGRETLLCFWRGKKEKEKDEGKPTGEGAEAREEAQWGQAHIVAPREAEILLSLLVLLHRCHLFSLPMTTLLLAASL